MNHLPTSTSPRLSARLAAAGGVSAILLLSVAPVAQADAYPPPAPTSTETTVPPSGVLPESRVLGARAQLPLTGSEIAQIAAAGVAVAAGGTALVVLGRRRGLRKN